MVVGFLVASIYAVGMLRGRRDRLHRLGLLIPLTIACIVTPIQLFVGDTAAREVADHQPAKFAGMECIQETGSHQTEYVGGICTDDGVKWAIPIPDLDSFLVGFSADTLLHLAFDAMVGIGSALLLLGVWLAWAWWRRRDIPRTPWFLRAVAVSGIGAILALWFGWIVTEVGRQPWIVQGYMRTEEAVTEAKGIWFAFGGILLLYAGLGTGAILVLRAMSRRWRTEDEAVTEDEVPYGPQEATAK